MPPMMRYPMAPPEQPAPAPGSAAPWTGLPALGQYIYEKVGPWIGPRAPQPPAPAVETPQVQVPDFGNLVPTAPEPVAAATSAPATPRGAPGEGTLQYATGVRVNEGARGSGRGQTPGGSSNWTGRMAAADVFDPEASGQGDARWRASLDERYGTTEENAFDPRRDAMDEQQFELAKATTAQQLQRARMSPRELAELESLRNPQFNIFQSTQERTQEILDDADQAIARARVDQSLTPEQREQRVAYIESERNRLVEQFNPRVRQE